MHSKGDNIEIMINDTADKIFQSLLSRYQIKLETLIKGIQVAFNCVLLIYYECHKIKQIWGKSNFDSAEWIKTKKNNNKSH